MTNLLTNPTLSGFTLGRYFTEQNGQVGTIEFSPNWEFVAYPREADPNKLPQSLHRDRGFVIAAGYRAWEGGFVQKGIQLQANQRYLMKAQFKPDINFPNDKVDLTAVTWRFRIVSSTGKTIEQDWTMTQKDRFKQDEEHTFVFDSTEAQVVEFQFMARSVFAGNAADFNVYMLSLEAVDANYGNVAPALSTAATNPAPAAQTVTAPSPASVAAVAPTSTGPSGKALGSVLSAAEIDTIAASLRELAKQVPSAAAGLNTLASGLERLK